MGNLFNSSDVVARLTDEDITGKWVIIKPKAVIEVFFEENQTQNNQLFKAQAGFGCKSGSLSTKGGKVMGKDPEGIADFWYRNEVLGLAAPHILEEWGLSND